MGMMFARRREAARKEHEANKAKAHAENHAKAKAEHAKSAAPAPKPVEPPKGK